MAQGERAAEDRGTTVKHFRLLTPELPIIIGLMVVGYLLVGWWLVFVIVLGEATYHAPWWRP
jgi:hypothetical protein